MEVEEGRENTKRREDEGVYMRVTQEGTRDTEGGRNRKGRR